MRARLSIIIILGFAAAFLEAGHAQATPPNVTGRYRCEPGVSTCQWSGNAFIVTQKGSELEAKNDEGAVGDGTVTSDISISMGPPWNMNGVISKDTDEIEWSNGTSWRKQ